MISYVEKKSWTNARTGIESQTLIVHHKIGNKTKNLHYGAADKIPDTVMIIPKS